MRAAIARVATMAVVVDLIILLGCAARLVMEMVEFIFVDNVYFAVNKQTVGTVIFSSRPITACCTSQLGPISLTPSLVLQRLRSVQRRPIHARCLQH